MRKEVFSLILAGLAYSLMSFAYMHNTFPSKDSYKELLNEIRYIRMRIDSMRNLGEK